MPGMDALLDSFDLCCDRGVLAGKNIQAEPCGRAGIRPSFSSAMILNSSAVPLRPFAEIMPSSARAHRRPRHSLADRGSIISVVLTALKIGLHITGRHQPHRMAKRPKLTAPMMGTWAGSNANNARRQSREGLKHLGAAHTLADHNRAIVIHAVNLKYRFRNIETNRASLAHGRLPSKWFASTQPPYGTSMPQSGRRPQHQSRRFGPYR